jgi:amino acid transporter
MPKKLIDALLIAGLVAVVLLLLLDLADVISLGNTAEFIVYLATAVLILLVFLRNKQQEDSGKDQ